MKVGFTVIEFIVGMLVASILLSTLLASFFNINAVLRIAQDIIDLDTRAAIVQNQLEKDLSGAFVPVQVAPSPAKEEKDKKKPIGDIFMSKNKDGQLLVLTFISNNPIIVYSQKRIAKPRVVRIVYRLVPEENKKDSFKLLRQEGTELDFKAYDLKTGKIKAYELATLLKKLTVEFKIPKPPEKGKSDKEKIIEFESAKEWPLERKESDKQQGVPNFVTITMNLWDNEQREERSGQFNITIPGASLVYTQTTEQPEPKTDAAAKQKTEKELAALSDSLAKALKQAIKSLTHTGTIKT